MLELTRYVGKNLFPVSIAHGRVSKMAARENQTELASLRASVINDVINKASAVCNRSSIVVLSVSNALANLKETMRSAVLKCLTCFLFCFSINLVEKTEGRKAPC